MPLRLQQGFLFFLLLSAMVMLWSLQSLAWSKAIVELQPVSVVTGEEVRLGQIAQIQGASKGQRELLGSIVVGQAPAPARRLEVRRSYVVAKMKQHLIDMNAVLVQGPDKVVVRADGNVLPGERLVELAQEYVLEQTGWSENDVTFEIPRIPSDQHLPPGELDVAIWKVSGDFYGVTHFRTRIKVDGEAAVSVPVLLKIHRFADVLRVRGDLEPNTVLTKNDVQLCRADLSLESQRVRRGYCKPDFPIAGKRVRSSMNAGRVLVYSMLIDPPVIERGEQISIEIQRNGVFVSAQGVARKAGAVGETITVNSLTSGKPLLARVVRPGIVTVD